MPAKRAPDFENGIKKVLKKEKPIRPTLFEFIIDNQLKEILAGGFKPDYDNCYDIYKLNVLAYLKAGYDFAPALNINFKFNRKPIENYKRTYSLNSGCLIYDEESFEKYVFNDPEDYDYDDFKRIEKIMPDNFKLMAYAYDGILENVIKITGYENLCYMLIDYPHVVEAVFENIGKRILKHFEICLEYDSVGFIMCNDDWGFNTSTMLSHADLRKYVYPWYIKIAEAAHKKGKFAVIHSCGNFEGIYVDLYNVIKFDGKHSNEDSILPVEEAYARYHKNIAILGGIDMNFLALQTPENVYKRCSQMLEISSEDGSYALGSGNSIPDYVPVENFTAMIRAAYPEFKLE